MQPVAVESWRPSKNVQFIAELDLSHDEVLSLYGAPLIEGESQKEHLAVFRLNDGTTVALYSDQNRPIVGWTLMTYGADTALPVLSAFLEEAGIAKKRVIAIRRYSEDR